MSLQQLKHQWADQTVLQKLLLICDKACFLQSNAIANDKPSVLIGFIDTVASHRHVHLADITWGRHSTSSKSADF